MSRAATMNTDVGYILNIISNDLSRFDDVSYLKKKKVTCFAILNIFFFILLLNSQLMFSIMYIVIGPLIAFAVLIYMIHILGLASLGLLMVLVVLLPYQSICGKYFDKFRYFSYQILIIVRNCWCFPFRVKTAHLTDKRIKSMEEMISSIKIIKMFTWEQSFADIVSSLRK